MGIDSGYNPSEQQGRDNYKHAVYEFVSGCGAHVVATKGASHDMDANYKHTLTQYSPRGRKVRQVSLWILDSDVYKKAVHRALTQPLDRPGGLHFPHDAPEYLVKQLLGEKRVIKDNGEFEWKRLGENHLLDVTYIVFALAEIKNIRQKVKTAEEYAKAQAAQQAALAVEAAPMAPENDWVGIEGDWV